jgi:hypothetical protein
MTDVWYTERINSGYSRVTTFQGVVMAPGMRRPQFRALRFYELYFDDDRAITTEDVTSSNFITPKATPAQVFYVDNVYDLTNDRPLRRRAIRYMNRLNPQTTAIPRVWCPAGKETAGYYIHPIPGDSTDEISVRERTYQYPVPLSGTKTPVIPPAWHAAIWMAAASEGAALIDWPEKAGEMEQMFMKFIAERKSPVEAAGAAGGRRHFTVGGI